jgi:hypothetical protein
MITSFIIHYLDWQGCRRFGRFGVICPNWRLITQVDCLHEMRPMAFLDPSAFVGTNQKDEPITSGLPVIRPK